ncbi:MAG: PIN domain nuclease [Candidatus Electronema sp. V4]|uniref:PIN domain nuclease n=1 Tax=Candidatus Electronema sp. V4 TaxID=3454756 RepID=UPI00405553CD
MSIKASLSKLNLHLSFLDMVREHVSGNSMKLLHIIPEHLEFARSLLFHHKDSFDRLLIAQSLSENILVLSRDQVFYDYAGMQSITAAARPAP